MPGGAASCVWSNESVRVSRPTRLIVIDRIVRDLQRGAAGEQAYPDLASTGR